MEKLEALGKIAEIMEQNKLNYMDVLLYAGVGDSRCDLLCVSENGQKLRLPFVKHSLARPIGLFPFKDSGEYLELEQIDTTSRFFADERRLPPAKFLEKVWQIRQEVNSCLEELGSPKLDGCYFMRGNYLSGCNWIAGFNDGGSQRGDYFRLSFEEYPQGCMPSDYYDSDELAIIRYYGVF